MFDPKGKTLKQIMDYVAEHPEEKDAVLKAVEEYEATSQGGTEKKPTSYIWLWVAGGLAMAVAAYLMTDHTAPIILEVEQAVRQGLKDPESAKFTNVRRAERQVAPAPVYCGFVNAKGSYGGYTGFQEFFVMLDANGNVPADGVIFRNKDDNEDDLSMWLRVSNGMCMTQDEYMKAVVKERPINEAAKILGLTEDKIYDYAKKEGISTVTPSL